MFIVKGRHPLYSVVIGLALLVLLWRMMESLYNMPDPSSEAKGAVLRDPGRSYFDEERLKPFVASKYEKASAFPEIRGEVEKLTEELADTNRDKLARFIEVDFGWEEVVSNPRRYSGIMMPMYTNEVELAGNGESKAFSWLSFKDGVGREFLGCVQLVNRSGLDGHSFYMDFIYLGSWEEEGKSFHVGIAKELYELPGNGMYPVMASDELALADIIDDFSSELAEEASHVPGLILSHFFGRLQRGAFQDQAVMKGVGYGELMQTPDRYRSKTVEFVGRLVYLVRRKMSGMAIVPGMEYYYEGILLNSDRQTFAFRALDVSGIKLKQIVCLEGIFLQRYNYVNRLNKRVWVPLVIATKLSPQIQVSMELSRDWKIAIAVGLALLAVLLIVAVRTGHRSSRAALELVRHKRTGKVLRRFGKGGPRGDKTDNQGTKPSDNKEGEGGVSS
ncbi:MAG: hypothetical protein HQL31_00365 [Planctomycetes bacterium]|nr:hypothetical protein [Planctomycetota bacterium]